MLATRAGVLWVACAVLFIYASAPAHAVNCYHGMVTAGEDDSAITDSQFWLENAGDQRAGSPVNCSKRVGDTFDTCSVFCRHYEMLTSGKIVVSCRRFCHTFEGCNASRFQEDNYCEGIKLLPVGNTRLTKCTQKCSQGRNSNFEASCTKRFPGYCNRSLEVTGSASSLDSRDWRWTVLIGGLIALLTPTVLLT